MQALLGSAKYAVELHRKCKSLPYSLLESPIVGGRAIEPPALFRDVELCLNNIIREDMQGLIYVRV